MTRFLGIVVVVLVALVGIAFVLPDSYTVERSLRITATPERVHELVGDLERWPEWEPWREGDPTIVVTLGDSTTGIGAQQRWEGESGSGELTFTSSSPANGIEYDLAFDGGSWRSKAAMRYVSEGDKTRVMWVMSGDLSANPIERYFGLLSGFLIGPKFERGLEKLKVAAEKPAG